LFSICDFCGKSPSIYPPSSTLIAMDSRARLLCVPITETAVDNCFAAIQDSERLADIIELRLDYFSIDTLPQVIAELRARIAQIGKPLIITFRPREQGGRRDLTLPDRQNFWRSLPQEIVRAMAFADFELDLAESFAEASPIPWSKVICSWHDMEETPAGLLEIYERIAGTRASVVKIATQAIRIGDCLQLFELIERKSAGPPMIVLGMGMTGLMTRILALSRGAMLTFGALRRGAESASGQPTVDELKDLYRVKQLTRESEILGVIGNPIGHSRSPLMHNAVLKALGRNGVYLPFEVDSAADFVRDFVRPTTRKIDWRLRGLSVTIPHKLAIIPHLDFIDVTAERIGAVNTVVIEGDRLLGHNTDVIGAMKPLDELIDVKGARAAVIGAGGSARAICYGLSERGAEITVYARDLYKAQLLADEFKTSAGTIAGFDGHADLMINCTPIGMRGHSEGQAPVRAEQVRGVKLVYDLVYNPEETALLRDARAAGCRTLGGLSMLVGQAAEQFRLWTGLDAPIDVMWRAVSSRE
jgi:3-dehydroquinate dehydratase / shikimate dehydrogenase